MRDEILEYIRSITLGTFKLSQEFPRDESGLAIYLKNLKTIYVDATQVTQEPLLQTFGGCSIFTESSVVSIFFTADAKTIPANYSSLVNSLKQGKNIKPELGFTNRQVEVSTEYVDDNLVTTIDYTFSKIT